MIRGELVLPAFSHIHFRLTAEEVNIFPRSPLFKYWKQVHNKYVSVNKSD